MKNHIPKLLLYTRLFFACIIIGLSIFQLNYAGKIVLMLLYIGILTDVFDGIIARKLNVSTGNLRVLDTVIDLLFYLSVFAFIVKTNPDTFYDNRFVLVIIFFLEFLMYLTSLIKFGKLPSPHAIISKFWGIYIVVEFTLLLLGVSGTHFPVALVIGVFVHADRVLIYALLKKWEHDLPSCYHAYKRRKGESIKRMKLFNG